MFINHGLLDNELATHLRKTRTTLPIAVFFRGKKNSLLTINPSTNSFLSLHARMHARAEVDIYCVFSERHLFQYSYNPRFI